MACANVNVDIDEDQVEKQLGHLVIVFPETDPEYLHRKVLEFVGKDAEFARWIDETLESGVADLPTRKDYESRLKVRISIFISVFKMVLFIVYFYPVLCEFEFQVQLPNIDARGLKIRESPIFFGFVVFLFLVVCC